MSLQLSIKRSLTTMNCNCEDLKKLLEAMAQSINEKIEKEIQKNNEKLVEDIANALKGTQTKSTA